MTEPRYIIGIDLGTTNCVVAYTESKIEKGKKPEIRVLTIPQVVSVGTVENRELLPSFVLVPGKHDVPEGAMDLPWSSGTDISIGEFARERGAEIPHRLIFSSKSWLCHTFIDRNKAILPWEGPDDRQKLSPVEATAEIMKHIREAWNHTMASEDESLRMEYQDVLVTVPASFDAVARDLTVKSAEMAGLKSITLLEEPQAAFYSWIESSGERWRDHVQKGDLILVCDVGGGTSDFSLISVSESDGELALERVAVGNHLLVGGDNIDLALAYLTHQKLFPKAKRTDPWNIRNLWHACRKAKEVLLSDADATDFPIALLGRGSGLIGGTKKTKLTKKEVEDSILNGFFPQCDLAVQPLSGNKMGIQEAGLTYESDPAITHHLAQFLKRHEDIGTHFPTAVLFNGGVMKANSIRKQILNVVSSWISKENSQPVREIQASSYDLAVARGAAYYGLALRGEGIRIRSGLEKTYYIGVAASIPAVPGMPAPIRALCVAPFGMEEGTSAALTDQEFILVVGEPVKFDFMGSLIRVHDTSGMIVDQWEDEIQPITTIETTLDGEPGSVIPVILETRVTEIGTLELWCVSREDGKKWKLEFNVREQK